MAGIGGKQPSPSTRRRVRGQGRIHHDLCEQVIVGVHVGLLGEGFIRRLLICTLHQPDGCPVRKQPARIGFGSVEIGLEHQTCALITLLTHLAKQVDGLVSVGGVFHIDADEVIVLLRTRQDALQVLRAHAFIKPQPDLRQLDRNIGAYAGGLDLVQRA